MAVKGLGSEAGASNLCPAPQSPRELGQTLNLSLVLKRRVRQHLLLRNVLRHALRTVPACGKCAYE